MVENNLIVKSNKLIEARYKLTLNEQKVVLYAISKLDNEQKEDANILEFKTTEFTSLIGTTSERYTEIREILRSLRKKEIIINIEKREIITGWLNTIEKKENGNIELTFEQKLMPYLLQLKEQFTQYQLKNILHLKNKYSIRVYELLKQYQTIRNREFKIEELKKMLGCENKYKDFRNFKKFVLDIVTKEINEHTDINVNYEKIKEGRKTIGVKFTIKAKPDEQDLLVKSLYSKEEIENIIKKSGLNKIQFNNKQIMELYTIAVEAVDNLDIDVFEYIRFNYEDITRRGAVKNKFAYLKKALEQDFASAKNQLRFNFDLNEDKMKELEEQIEKADNPLVRQILKKELDSLLKL